MGVNPIPKIHLTTHKANTQDPPDDSQKANTQDPPDDSQPANTQDPPERSK